MKPSQEINQTTSRFPNSSVQFRRCTPCNSPPNSPSINSDDDSTASVSSEEDEFDSLMPDPDSQFSEDHCGEALEGLFQNSVENSLVKPNQVSLQYLLHKSLLI